MALLDRHLANAGAFVAGDTFSLADVVIGVSAHRWRSTPIERIDLPAVAAYMERLAQVPGFAENCSVATP